MKVKCKDCGNVLIEGKDIVGLVPFCDWDVESAMMEDIYYQCTGCGRRVEYDTVCKLVGR